MRIFQVFLSLKLPSQYDGTIAFSTFNEQKFPLLLFYCRIADVTSIASAAESNCLSQGVILEHNNKTRQNIRRT
jgi:putative hemolysin